MPSVSGSQQRLMGSALRRKMAGHPRQTDPQMSTGRLRDFAATPRRGLPDRVHKRSSPAKGYGKGPVGR